MNNGSFSFFERAGERASRPRAQVGDRIVVDGHIGRVYEMKQDRDGSYIYRTKWIERKILWSWVLESEIEDVFEK